MLRLIAVAGLALAITTPTQAMAPAPPPQPDAMVTHIRLGCGPGMTMRSGTCVARSTVRQARRCARWTGDVCASWQ
jgi:hypothetical protein